jgi:hypothetical protein
MRRRRPRAATCLAETTNNVVRGSSEIRIGIDNLSGDTKMRLAPGSH